MIRYRLLPDALVRFCILFRHHHQNMAKVKLTTRMAKVKLTTSLIFVFILAPLSEWKIIPTSVYQIGAICAANPHIHNHIRISSAVTIS